MARWLNRITSETVVVFTQDGKSIKGILRGVYSDALVLANATYMGSAGDGQAIMNVAVDGQATIPRSNVSWMQVLPPEVGT